MLKESTNQSCSCLNLRVYIERQNDIFFSLLIQMYFYFTCTDLLTKSCSSWPCLILSMGGSSFPFWFRAFSPSIKRYVSSSVVFTLHPIFTCCWQTKRARASFDLLRHPACAGTLWRQFYKNRLDTDWFAVNTRYRTLHAAGKEESPSQFP